MGHLGLCWILPFLWPVKGGHGGLRDTLVGLQAEFAVSLYQTLAGTDNNSNLIVSPLGVSTSLELLQFGAHGRTLVQVEDVLSYNIKDAHVQELLQWVHGDLANSSQTTAVSMACTLFVQRGTPLLSDFTQKASGWGNTSLVYTNFSWPNHTHSQVEEWAYSHGSGENQSHPPTWTDYLEWAEPLADSSRWLGPHMMLTSMLTFHGTWQRKFLLGETQELPFILADGSVCKVPTMHQATDALFGQFSTSTEHRYVVLELPYLGGSFGLQVVLPSDRKLPLSQLEAELTGNVLASWDAGLRRTKMDVFLPRFTVHSRLNLRSALRALGILDVFHPIIADLKGISAEEGLYVSEAMHEAKMEVTEDGTQAEAATVMVLLKRSRSPVFKADRPFLFLLRQSSTGSILFMGRVLNPAEQKS